MLPTSIAGSIRIAEPLIVSPGDDRAHVDGARTGSRARARRRAGGRRARWRRSRSRRASRPRRAGSAGRRRPGRCSPAGPSRWATSSARAGAERRPAARCASLISLTRWSPRTTTTFIRVAVDDHRERLQQRAGGHARARARRASIVVIAGRVDRARARRAPAAAAPAGRRRWRPRRWPRSRAPAPRRSRRPRTAPCTRAAPRPPIIPTSASTRYHSSPQRSQHPVVGDHVLVVAARRAPRGRGRTCRRPS